MGTTAGSTSTGTAVPASAGGTVGADTTGNALAGSGAIGSTVTGREPGQSSTSHVRGGLRENPDAENSDAEAKRYIAEGKKRAAEKKKQRQADARAGAKAGAKAKTVKTKRKAAARKK